MIDKALRDGKLSTKALTASYAYVYKDGPTPELGMGSGGAAEQKPQTGQFSDHTVFTVTTLDEDRDGDTVIPMGWYGKNYMQAGGPWFFDHQEWKIAIGNSMAPDGRFCVFPEDNRVQQWLWWDKSDPDAMFLKGKYDRGIMRGSSIAFVPIKAFRKDDIQKAHQHNGGPNGYVFEEWDHTETSACGVGSNPRATAQQKSMRSQMRDALDKDRKNISQRLQKCLVQRGYCELSTNEKGGCFTGWCPTCPPAEKNKTKTKGVAGDLLDWALGIKRVYPGDRVTTPKGGAEVVSVGSNGVKVRLDSGAETTFWLQDLKSKSMTTKRSCPCSGACKCKAKGVKTKALQWKQNASGDIHTASFGNGGTVTIEDMTSAYDNKPAFDVTINGNKVGTYRSLQSAKQTIESTIANIERMTGKSVKSQRHKDLDTQYDQGYVAAHEGRARSTNPYRTDSDERGGQMREDWDNGWRDGAKERLMGKSKQTKSIVVDGVRYVAQPRQKASTSSDVRSPTSTETSTEAYTSGNFTATVTGGAGDGDTVVNIYPVNPDDEEEEDKDKVGTSKVGLMKMTKYITVNGVRYKAVAKASTDGGLKCPICGADHLGDIGGDRYECPNGHKFPKSLAKALGESSGAAGGYVAEKADEKKCPGCKGFGEVLRGGEMLTCPMCKGTGKIPVKLPAKSHRCTFCKGTTNGCGKRGDCPYCVKGIRKSLTAEIYSDNNEWFWFDAANRQGRNRGPFRSRGDAVLSAQHEGYEAKSMRRQRRKAQGDDVEAKGEGEGMVHEDTAPPHEVAMAHLYNHAKSEHEYVTQALEDITPFDPKTGEANKAHEALKDYGEQVGQRLESLKSMYSDHTEGKDVDEAVKGLDSDDTGEANLVNNGQVPEETMDLDDESEVHMGIDENELAPDTNDFHEDPNELDDVQMDLDDPVEMDEGEMEEKAVGDACPFCDGTGTNNSTGDPCMACNSTGQVPKDDDSALEKAVDDAETKEPDEFADDPDTEEILERYVKDNRYRTRRVTATRAAKVLRAGGRIKKGQDGRKWLVGKSTSSSESLQTPYGVDVRVRGGGNTSKWFSTPEEREKFIDKLADKYGGYEVLDVRFADPPNKSFKGQDGRKWLVAGVRKAKTATCASCGWTGTPTGFPGTERCPECKMPIKPAKHHKSLDNEGNPAELKSETSEAVKACGNMLKGMAASHDMAEHHKSALDMHGDAIGKALEGDGDVGEAVTAAHKHMKSLADAPDVPDHHQEALSFHAKSMAKAMKELGAGEEKEAPKDGEEEKAEGDEETKDEVTDEQKAIDDAVNDEATKELFAQLAKDVTDLRVVKRRVGLK